METRDPPSLLNRVLTPPLLLVSGVSAVLWSIYRVIVLYKSLSAQVVLFDKGSYYMLGVGVGLLSLAFVTIKEFWGGKPITNKQNRILTKLAISGIVLMFLVPHIAHFITDKYLENHGYSICEEASHQWLFVRDIVYVQSPTECSADLKKKLLKGGLSDYFLINPSAYEAVGDETGLALSYITLPTMRWSKFNPSVPFCRLQS